MISFHWYVTKTEKHWNHSDNKTLELFNLLWPLIVTRNLFINWLWKMVYVGCFPDGTRSVPDIRLLYTFLYKKPRWTLHWTVTSNLSPKKWSSYNFHYPDDKCGSTYEQIPRKNKLVWAALDSSNFGPIDQNSRNGQNGWYATDLWRWPAKHKSWLILKQLWAILDFFMNMLLGSFS